MSRRVRAQRGSSMLEYAVLIMAIVAGLVAMRGWLTAAVGGLARQAADTFGSGQQVDAAFVPED